MSELLLPERLQELLSEEAVMATWKEWRRPLRTMGLEIQPFGDNWRGVKVGQASLLLRPDGHYFTVVAPNYKPTPGDHPRICAEDATFEVAEATNSVIVAMAIVGLPKADDLTQIDIGKLIPCKKTCQGRVAHLIRVGLLLPHTIFDLVDVSRPKDQHALFAAEMLALKHDHHVEIDPFPHHMEDVSA